MMGRNAAGEVKRASRQDGPHLHLADGYLAAVVKGDAELIDILGGVDRLLDVQGNQRDGRYPGRIIALADDQ